MSKHRTCRQHFATALAPLIAVCALVPLAHSAQAETPRAALDLPALIECRASYADFVALGPLLETPLKAVAAGLQPLPQANMFMSEYRLAQPVQVFGHTTEHLAFTGGGIVAVLDLPDPRPLAKQLALEAALDTPGKVLFGREVRSEDAVRADGKAVIDSAVITVSNVSSHPGKTLAGCSYSTELLEESDEPDAEQATESTPVSAASP